MINKETIEQIATNLKLLTEQGTLEWTHNKGIYVVDFEGDNYDLSVLDLRINQSTVAIVAFSPGLMSLYMLLNAKYVGDPALDKLNKAVDRNMFGKD